LSRNSLYLIVLLTVIWVILRESFSVATIIIGIVVSAFCVLFSRKLIPLTRTDAVKPFRLLIYIPYLLGQIYIGGIAAIKIILFGAHVEIVEVRTRIKSALLRTILVNSITLVPGSISLDLTGDRITILWLMRKTETAPDTENADELLKAKLERMLLKAEK